MIAYLQFHELRSARAEVERLKKKVESELKQTNLDGTPRGNSDCPSWIALGNAKDMLTYLRDQYRT